MYREVRRGELVFVCAMPDRSGELIPAWMFDAAVCGRFRTGSPQVSLEALDFLRVILDEIGLDRAAAATNPQPKESANATNAEHADLSRTTDATKSASARAANRKTRPEKSRGGSGRSSQTTSRSGRKLSKKRGVR
jgi:hypothetical protein